MSDPFFRTEEKSQFSPDITPLILSAHYNNHEIIQMFLSRNQTIERPHPISCQCRDCVIKQNYDSLKRSRSRLNAYRALASPAFMALSSRDPIMATFELRQEMKKLAQVEKEFQVSVTICGRGIEICSITCQAEQNSIRIRILLKTRHLRSSSFVLRFVYRVGTKQSDLDSCTIFLKFTPYQC